MKNNTLLGAYNPKNPQIKHFFRIMRITLFLLLTCVLSLHAGNSYSQNAKVSLDMNNAKLEKVLDNIESQTNYLFIYISQINTNKRVTVKANKLEVSKVLDQIFQNTDIHYKLEGSHIILSKNTENTHNLSSTTIQQQKTKKVTGTVVDNTGEPIIGANIKVKGTDSGTITDIDGNFSIDVTPNDVLIFSFIGYTDKEITIGNQTTIHVTMEENTQMLNEVVVVGFGSQKKVNLTGSVAVVDSKELASRPVVNVSQALQGLVPGMNFSYAGDSDGGGLNTEMKINIRGTGTIGDGSTSSPLILIDGMEGNMNMLNPQDIESISVLKDAAASSIYGSRAPFGVVLITTKKGKAGKVSINYNNNFRWTQAINMPEVVDSYTYASYFNKMLTNDGGTPYFDAERMSAIKGYLDGTIKTTTAPDRQTPTIWDWIGNTNTDWYDVVFGHTAFSQEHSISANGGTEKFQYYFSGNFMDQEGLISIRPDRLERYTVTGKINAELFPWLKFSYNTKYMRKDYFRPSKAGSTVLYNNIAKRWPMEPTKDPNGHYMSNTIINPIMYGGDSNTQTDWLYQQFQIVAEPIKNWKIFGELNYKTIDEFAHSDNLKVPMWDTSNEMYIDSQNNTNSVSERTERSNYFNSNIYTEYSGIFNNAHSYKVMVGFQAELNKWRKLAATRNDLISEEVPNINVAGGDSKIDGADKNHWATAGFFGRVNYDYKARYLLEVNLRYDGTSRFLKDQRWNMFPSFSVGWNIAHEAFMEPYSDLIGNLKLRGSWGELGNQNTSSLYPFIQLMKFAAADKDSNWLINNKRPNTANAPDLISALLGWETMRSWNVGLDIAMFSNRLTMSFDWFNRKTVNMVGPAMELPMILGTAVPKTNNADMVSRGFELDLGWRDKIQDFSYNVHVLLSDDRQKILRYPNIDGQLSQWRAGQYMGEIWGFETIGIAKTQEEMDAHLASLPNGGQGFGSKWGAGDIMYKDLNNDGQITEGATISDPGDLKIIGNDSPRFKFGLDLNGSWKGFDVRLFFQGVAKRDFWFNDNMFWGANGGMWASTAFKPHMDFFNATADDAFDVNLNAYYPRPLDNGSKNQKVQTRYLQNAAYVRMKNLQIGYTIPANITQRAGISNLRIFFSGENLFTLTGLPDGFDPETIGSGYGGQASSMSGSGKAYPLSRTFSAGFSVNF